MTIFNRNVKKCTLIISGLCKSSFMKSNLCTVFICERKAFAQFQLSSVAMKTRD